MQFCKLGVFNLAYLYVSHVLTKHIARWQNCLKMSNIETSPLKSNTKLKMNRIVKRGKTTEVKEKVAIKEQEKRKK